MENVQKLKITGFIASIVCVAFGIVLLIWPDASLKMIVTILGIISIIGGLIQVVAYFMRNHEKSLFRNDFAYGLIILMLGIVMLTNTETIGVLLPVLLGSLILISGIFKLQRALDLGQIAFNGWIAMLLFALLSGILGVIMIANPFRDDISMMNYIGIAFVLDGISGFISAFFFQNEVKKYFRQLSKEEKDIQQKKEKDIQQKKEKKAETSKKEAKKKETEKNEINKEEAGKETDKEADKAEIIEHIIEQMEEK